MPRPRPRASPGRQEQPMAFRDRAAPDTQELAPNGTRAHQSSTHCHNRLAVGDGAFSSIHVLPTPDAEPTTERFSWDRESLEPYRRYQALYLERKMSKPHPTQTFPFMKLPRELRDQIYRDALVFKPPPELAAKTNVYDHGNTDAIKHHTTRFYEAKTSLGLLRVSKQMRREASAIFYGENEWRFTNVKGIYALDAFLHQIGKNNRALLKKIALHVPWTGNVHDSWRDDLGESIKQRELAREVLHRMGLRPSKHDWHFNKERCLRRVVRFLEGAGALRQLSLVLPDTFELSKQRDDRGRENGYDFLLNPAKFERLKTSLVILKALSEDMTVGKWADCVASHADARAEAERRDMKIVEVHYDWNGYWPVAPPKPSGRNEEDDADNDDTNA